MKKESVYRIYDVYLYMLSILLSVYYQEIVEGDGWYRPFLNISDNCLLTVEGNRTYPIPAESCI